jgi:spore maturation protein CgeB
VRGDIVNILYAGMLGAGETCEMRRRALERIGHRTIPVNLTTVLKSYAPLLRRPQWKLRFGPMISCYNAAILEAADSRPDVAWIDKGLFLKASTISALRRRGVSAVVHYSPDNYLLAQNTSRHLRRALQSYDLVVTTKSANVERLSAMGARRVLLSHNSYDPEVHRPVGLTTEEQVRFGADVAFIGRWEQKRERLLEQVARLGVKLAVWGPGWTAARGSLVGAAYRGDGAFADNYAKAIRGARIVLGLLSDLAEDTITQRSVEIPACGGFLLAKRTAEHAQTFREGDEAEFFDGFEELAAKIRRYLDDDTARQRIAARGRDRCVSGGYSYPERMQAILSVLQQQRPTLLTCTAF